MILVTQIMMEIIRQTAAKQQQINILSIRQK